MIGTMVQEVRTPAIAQILKQVGFDFLMLDMEHGAFNLETAAEIIRVARLVEIPPLVRVAGPQYELIGRILDQGAVGVMLPWWSAAPRSSCSSNRSNTRRSASAGCRRTRPTAATTSSRSRNSSYA